MLIFHWLYKQKRSQPQASMGRARSVWVLEETAGASFSRAVWEKLQALGGRPLALGPQGPRLGADFLKRARGPILGPRGGQKWIPREISCRSHLFSYLFDVFLKIFFFHILFFSKSGLSQNPGRKKKRVFNILTSKKYGVNDPSDISHFCLSSKLHFFNFF